MRSTGFRGVREAMWLPLLRLRCLKRVLAMPSALMTSAERAKLVDAALRSEDPEAYLAGVQGAFDEAGREHDATITASVQLLYRAGEIELLMFMRADWLGRFASRQSRPTRST